MDKKLEVKNLRISFRTDAGKVQAVRGIDFDLYKGETLAIVGESGSGKSVTNKAIIGISAVNAIVESGEIIYEDKDLLQISEDDFHKLRGDKIAMIFQDPLSALDPICRIGKQLTEAMILKNRSSRRESRKEMNKTFKNLLIAMNEAMGAEKKSPVAERNAKNIADFRAFEKTHLKLEGAYNDAKQGATVGLQQANDLLFHIEKSAVEEFSRNSKSIAKNAAKAINKYVVEDGDNLKALLLRFREECKLAKKSKSYNECAATLTEIRDVLQEADKRDTPNFFTMGYYLTFSGQPLPDLDITETNIEMRKYLDEHFMIGFIADAQKGVQHSFEVSEENKQKVIDLIGTYRDTYALDTPVKKVYKATAKILCAEVKNSIDQLALVKDSTAYTFESSLLRTISAYFDAIPANAKEQKRYDKDMAKFNKIIARGKTPDYKVTPAKLVDLDIARQNIVHILDRLVDNYQHALKAVESFDSEKAAVGIIDLLKEKAVSVAYRVNQTVAKERALQIMAEVGIPEPRKRYRQYPFQFSGGMRQRIVIAIALAANPDILICDEPTTALDVTIQAQILELINKIKAERHLSVIFITHDLGVVANMADRIAVMYAGKIVEIGTAEDVFYAPAHPYTWALLSSMPDLDTNEKLEAIPGTPPNMIYPPKGDAFAARNKYAMKIDFEAEPPMFKISPTHSAATWLLHPNAPKVGIPKVVADRIERMKNLAKSVEEKAAEEKAAEDTDKGGDVQ